MRKRVIGYLGGGLLLAGAPVLADEAATARAASKHQMIMKMVACMRDRAANEKISYLQAAKACKQQISMPPEATPVNLASAVSLD